MGHESKAGVKEGKDGDEDDQVERKNDEDYLKACTRLVVEGTVPVGRPRNTWQNTSSAES